MMDIKTIKEAIESLSVEEYIHLRKWFSDKDWSKWDKQIEQDSKSGKLSFLVRDAASKKEVFFDKPVH